MVKNKMFNDIYDNQNKHYYSEQDSSQSENLQEDNYQQGGGEQVASHYYSPQDENEVEAVDFHSDYLGEPSQSFKQEDSYLNEDYADNYDSEDDFEESQGESFVDFDDASFFDSVDKNIEEFEDFDEEVTHFDSFDTFDEPRRTSFLNEVDEPIIKENDLSKETYEQEAQGEYFEAEEEAQENYEQGNEDFEEEEYTPQGELDNGYNAAIYPSYSKDTVEENEIEKSQEEIKEDIRRKYMVLDNGNLNIAKIMVLGVGGGGNNAVNRMIDLGVNTAHFVAINTDIQALMLSHCDTEDRYQIGAGETKGLGAGANPEVGERAAEESKELIEQLVDGVDLLFITAGMGGGTGSGAAPVIAKIAKEKGCLTVAVVTKPFFFEGATRIKNAEKAIANLKKYVDTIIIIPNDKLMEALRPDTPIVDALKYADDTLRQGICGIADLIATPSLINLDFADVRTILQNRGLAHMGVGRAKGENRILEAVKEAVSSPLLETTIEGAKGLILNVTGGKDLTLMQVREAASSVREIVDPSANVIFGMHIKENLQEEVIITLIATGFDSVDDSSNDDNTRAYNGLFNQKQQEARQDYSTYNVPRSEPDPYTAPDRQWQRVQPEREYPQYNSQPQFNGQPQQAQEPYTPHANVEQPKQEQHEEYLEQPSEKKGLPSFVTRIFGGKKKNQ